MTRFDLAALRAAYDLPFFDLISRAREVYRANWPEHEVQLCTLMSIKTGGCSEDCSYCAQSAHYSTGLEREALAPVATIVETAQRARANGSTRFCMGAAWKGITEKDAKFPQVLETVREVAKLGMEVCVTLGQLTPEAARQTARGGRDGLQSQPRHQPGVLPEHRDDAHVRRPAGDDPLGAGGGHVGLLRRHHRHGRDGGRPAEDAGSALRLRPGAGRACRSTASCRWRARPSPGKRRSIFSSSCG